MDNSDKDKEFPARAERGKESGGDKNSDRPSRPPQDRASGENRYPRSDKPREAGAGRSDKPREGGYQRQDRPRDGGYPRQDRPREGGFPRSDRPRDGNFARPERPRDGEFAKSDRPREGGFQRQDRPREGGFQRPDRPRDGGFARTGKPPRDRELAAVQDVDEEILRLIMRRAGLLMKLRTKGRLEADMEKKLRTSWEEKAARLGRDNRLSRDLFTLLQAIEPLSRMEEEQAFFNLAPSSRPVEIDMPAPADTLAARCWMMLASASGQPISLAHVPLTDSIIDAVKVINHMGGQLWWEDTGVILNRGGKGLHRDMDKVIHIGDDPFNLWLALAFSLGMPTHLKLTGGGDLRFLDLTPLSHFLPTMGARLTNVVPGQNGVPVRLECSGMLPTDLLLPSDLPQDFILALLLAAPFWEQPTRLILPNNSKDILATATALLRQADARIAVDGQTVAITPATLTLPPEPHLPMNVILGSALLALPALVGGETRLHGNWGSSPQATLAERLLRGAGLQVSCTATLATSTKSDTAPEVPSLELLTAIGREYPDLLPLAMVFCAALAKKGAVVRLPEAVKPAALATNGQPDGEQVEGEESSPAGQADDAHVLAGFLAQLGLQLDEQSRLVPVPKTPDEIATGVPAASFSWISPSAAWAVGMALGAFLRPQIRLANPGVLTDLYPAFWMLYNGLPKPDFSRKSAPEEPENAKPARRRIIAQGYAELPPEPTTGDDS